jgi:hypothetical protein
MSKVSENHFKRKVDVKETSKFAIACYPELVTSKIITFIDAEE